MEISRLPGFSMERESRVKKTLLNARMNTLCYLAGLAVTFFTRKIFLDNLGTDFLGLTTTTQGILSFLNLAELGIGSAIGCILYKPIFDNDRTKIKEIISVLGYLYRIVGLGILGLGILLSCFLPLIFANTSFSWGIIYLAFYASLGGSLIGYFVNYRASLLFADQRGYLVTGYFQFIGLAKTVLQACLVIYYHSYALFLIVEFLFGIINSVILNYKIDKVYPWLETEIKNGKLLFKKYPEIGKYMKQLFVHQIGGFIHGQLAPLLIFAYVSLSSVTLYGNYTILVQRVTSFVDGILNSTSASVGNLIAEGDQRKTYRIFEELFSVRFLVAGVLSLCVWQLGDSFLEIWLGNQYLLPKIILALVSINMFLGILFSIYNQFMNGYKLFADTWVPMCRIGSIAVCVLGGYLWGMEGILGAQILTTILLLHMWKPYYLFGKGFRLPFMKYIRLFVSNLLGLSATYIVSALLCRWILSSVDAAGGWAGWLINATVFTSLFGGIALIVSYSSQKGTRDFMYRILKRNPGKFTS